MAKFLLLFVGVEDGLMDNMSFSVILGWFEGDFEMLCGKDAGENISSSRKSQTWDC